MSAHLLEQVWAAQALQPALNHQEWETLLGQARQARLIARLAAYHHDNKGLSAVPVGPRPHLEGALRLADRQQHEVRWEVNCLSRALREVKSPVVLLKGAAYLMANLPAARGRLFADIDILVPRHEIDSVERALLAAGWISDERDPYNQRYYRQWMHEIPPLRHVQRNTYIDLHHTITPPTSHFNVDGDRLLADIKPLVGSSGIYVLSPVDMVLHSAVHLFQEGEFSHGLRDLLDMNSLVLGFEVEPDFWDRLLDRAQYLGLKIPLFHALFHIRRLFGTTPPQRLDLRIESLKPNLISCALMGWMLGLALRPDHPSCDSRWTGLARWMLYVRSHMLRMPLHLIVPHLLRKAWMRQFPDATH